MRSLGVLRTAGWGVAALAPVVAALVAEGGASRLIWALPVSLLALWVQTRRAASTSDGQVKALDMLATGDIRFRISPEQVDPHIYASLNKTTATLTEVIGAVRFNAALVTKAGAALMTESQALAQRTDHQAATVEETSASLEELASTVAQNAAHAKQAHIVAKDARRIVGQGVSDAGEAVRTIGEIQADSQRIADIISVINGIAYQTTLLALNAAVEAARAGEQGRGFAVVAGEVRALSQRSAAAAREIQALIEGSRSRVNVGVQRVAAVERSLASIATAVEGMATRVSEIAAATAEQSLGLSQMSEAAGALDGLTEQNAALVHKIRETATQLGEQSQRIVERLSDFRLRQGTADEAVALVRQAVTYAEANGLAALVNDINGPANKYCRLDLRVDICNADGIYIAASGKPEMIGYDITQSKLIDGRRFLRESQEVQTRGGGWVEYDAFNPATGRTEAKATFVAPLGGGVGVGCGVFKEGG